MDRTAPHLRLREPRPDRAPDRARSSGSGARPVRLNVLAALIGGGAAGGAAALGALPWMVVLAAVLGAAALIDGATGRIPNRLLATGTAAILALRLVADAPVGPALGAGAGVAVVLAVVRAGSIWWTGRPGLGMGDVKLGLVMGLALGWGALWALYLAAVVGAAVGTAGLASGRWTRSSPLPFAPFIAAGTAASALLPYSAALHLVSGV